LNGNFVSAAQQVIPTHIAIVMDGNGRWASARFQPRVFGHRAGVKAVRETVENAARAGVKILTLFAFSSENWQRPQEEVSGLMELFLRAVRSEAESLHRDGVCLRFVGELTRFADPLRREMHELVQLTAGNTRLILNVAVNYGGRWDICQAARRLALDVQAGLIDPNEINEQSFSPYLNMADVAPPDLVIRTGGEFRISNFLLWQAAYAELYFSKTLWPDFSKADLDAAIADFGTRQRRFGQTSEQVSA
jgi:undecaprenyl diphosphate synthase